MGFICKFEKKHISELFYDNPMKIKILHEFQCKLEEVIKA